MKRTYHRIVYFGIFFIYLTKDVVSNTTTTTAATTTSNVTSSSTATSSTTSNSTTSIVTATPIANTTALSGVTVDSSDNFTSMIVGIAVGVSVVAIAILATSITVAYFKKKKVHPSETDTIYSDYISESDYDSRPTTASHIFIDHAEETPSRPVTMTPFELRKLFVETFPYENWKPGFDGSLKPRMPLRFVHPSRYNRTKSEEQDFRRKIYQFEMTENLTISRPPSSTRMYTPAPTLFPTHVLEPVPERTVLQNGDVLHSDGSVITPEQTSVNQIDSTPVTTFHNLHPDDHEDQELHGLSSHSNTRTSSDAVNSNGEQGHSGMDSKLNGDKPKSGRCETERVLDIEDDDIEQHDNIMTTEL